MSRYRVVEIKNGNYWQDYYIYSCAICGNDVGESDPYVEDNGELYCYDCAFIRGAVEEAEYIKCALYFFDGIGRAVVHDGKIYTGSNHYKFPWECTGREQRRSAEYRAWRASVFERDGYKCQICGKVGGNLQAHHIKSYAKYPRYRIDPDNGITLCIDCHKGTHKRNAAIRR